MRIVAAHKVPCDTSIVVVPQSTWTAAGLRYERRAKSALAASAAALVVHNPAFSYTTNYGTRGYCIPDFLLFGLEFLGPEGVALLECKLTYKKEAQDKLRELYMPVVQCALQTDMVFPIVVAKNLTSTAPEPCFSLEAAWTRQTSGSVPVVQWLGRGEFPIRG